MMLLSELHPRQREIIQLVADGHTNSEIAALLGISIQTVKNVLFMLSEATGASNRYRLVLHFYKIIPNGKGKTYSEITA
jgi:DNA-binding NarL/FixJ family response regulator